jgi:hypothetical protein
MGSPVCTINDLCRFNLRKSYLTCTLKLWTKLCNVQMAPEYFKVCLSLQSPFLIRHFVLMFIGKLVTSILN